jgi:hypothetical protein
VRQRLDFSMRISDFDGVLSGADADPTRMLIFADSSAC